MFPAVLLEKYEGVTNRWIYAYRDYGSRGNTRRPRCAYYSEYYR